jgi:hypothetical protein
LARHTGKNGRHNPGVDRHRRKNWTDSVTAANWTVTRLNWPVTSADWTVTRLNWPVTSPDWTVTTLEWTVTGVDWTVPHADWTVTGPRSEPDGQRRRHVTRLNRASRAWEWASASLGPSPR